MVTMIVVGIVAGWVLLAALAALLLGRAVRLADRRHGVERATRAVLPRGVRIVG